MKSLGVKKISVEVALILAGMAVSSAHAGFYLETVTEGVSTIENRTGEIVSPNTENIDGGIAFTEQDEFESIRYTVKNNALDILFKNPDSVDNVSNVIGIGATRLMSKDLNLSVTNNRLTASVAPESMVNQWLPHLKGFDGRLLAEEATMDIDISHNDLSVQMREGDLILGVRGAQLKVEATTKTAESINITLNDNTVSVKGGKVLQGLGGVDVKNGWWGDPTSIDFGTVATAHRNALTVENATLELSMLAGFSVAVVRYSDYASEIPGSRIEASDNILVLDNVTIEGNEFSAAVVGSELLGSSKLTANNNVMHIKNALTFTDQTDAYQSELWGVGTRSGELLPNERPEEFFSNNTLILDAKNVSVGMIANFDNITFNIPADMQVGDAMLQLNGRTIDDSSIEKTLDLNKLNIRVGLNAFEGDLPADATFTLIENTDTGSNITLTPLEGDKNIVMANGALLETSGVLAMAEEGKKLTVTVGETRAAETSKSLSEAQLAGVAFVNQAADLAARQAGAVSLRGKAGFGSFADAEFADTKYKTGSHVDVDGYSLVAGGAWKGNLLNRDTVLGGFVEMGNGSYDAFNSFAAGDVRASGDTDYLGAGVMARMALTDAVFVDVSVRMGRVETDYRAGALGLSYETKSDYAGLHVGAGYEKALTANIDWLAYGQLLYTFQEGDSVTVDSRRVAFDDVHSLRSRLGTRLEAAVGPATLYAGAAWEVEFAGDADATVDGLKVEAPELDGSTGVFELGVTAPKVGGLPLSIGAGLRGYVGQREGVAGNATMTWHF